MGDAQHASPKPTQREFEELVKRGSCGEPGLAVEYFARYTEVDADLLSVSEAASVILSLYRLDVLDLIENEGYLVELYGDDVRAVFKPYERAGKISRIVLDKLKEYQRSGAGVEVRERSIEPPHETKDSPAVRREVQRTWHDVLGVGPTATMEEVQAAYRRKIALYHPDKVAGLGPELIAAAEKYSKEISKAYSEARRARGP
jgi:hypothetical protein